MKLNQINRLTLVLFAGFVLIAGFQNCSPTHHFALDTKSNKVAGNGNPSPEVEVETEVETEVEVEEQQSQMPVEKCQMIEPREVKIEGNISVVPCGSNSDEKCALVCHVPKGNPAARHNIVIGMKARLGPHAPGGHGGDYDGPCYDQPTVLEACIED